jgi:hypothetical protein
VVDTDRLWPVNNHDSMLDTSLITIRDTELLNRMEYQVEETAEDGP